MITNLDASSELFLANVNRIQQRIADASNRVSSGKQITVASDAPDQIGPLLQLRADQLHNTQVQSNLTLASTDVAGADNALNSATELMDRALVLANQAANATQTAETRQGIVQEIEALQEQMVSCSRTQVQDRFIFSGDQDGSPAYQLDLTSANGVMQLSGALSTRRIEDPAGGSFPASKTAQELFDSRNADGSTAPDNVFAALNSLRAALLDNDVTGIGNAIGSISQASDHLNLEQAFYGAVAKRIQYATDFTGKYDVQLQTEISQKEDADVVAAAQVFTLANSQLQAAFQMRAKIPATSLFNYLG